LKTRVGAGYRPSMPADAAVVSAAEPTRFRVALNRFLFRAMLFASGSVAIGLYQLSRPLAWRFAKLQARNLKLNEGLESRPLARVASGGELSRLMLALKVVLATHDVVPTLVFDEVDQGIGGEVGSRVGAALVDVSRAGRQALVITHLPQIAVHADQQLVVKKAQKGGIATSDVEVVAGESRIKEIARMLGDADMATARRHAVELLKTASETSASQSETPTPPAPTRPRR